MRQIAPGRVTKISSFPRLVSGSLAIESSSIHYMQRTNRKPTQRFINSRWLVLFLVLLLVLPLTTIRNHAEETVTVQTDLHPTEAHPIYLIAVPPQEKLAPRPLNVPIVPAREEKPKN